MTDEATRAAFERDGLCVVPGLVPESLVARVNETVGARRGHATDRLLDAWPGLPAVRELAGHPPVIDLLTDLYGRAPIPFQTLNFELGTEQPAHADVVHFDTLPTGWMCGVWVALEDVGTDQGPLRYWPGSHRVGAVPYDALGRTGDRIDYAAYEAWLDARLRGAGIEPVELAVSAGDVVVWHAELAHGGAPVRRAGSTRRSQVTHYFFEGCVHLTPMWSDFSSGELWVRDPLIDVRTRRTVIPMLDGRPARFERLPSGRARVLGADDPPLPLGRRLRSDLRGTAQLVRRRLAVNPRVVGLRRLRGRAAPRTGQRPDRG